MPFRLTRPALALAVIIAAVILAASPLLASDLGHANPTAEPDASELMADSDLRQTTSAVARVDQRDSGQDRVAKHRLVLVAILTALLATPLLLRAAAPQVELRRRVRLGAVSPFSGRAPPQLTFCCA